MKMRQLIHSAAACFCRDIFPENLTDIFFRFEPGCHQFVTASHTPQTEVSACAKDQPPFLTAGMGFFHHQNII